MLEHNAIGAVHLMLAILRAAPPQLLGALHDMGLYEDELRSELLRRHPTGAHYPIPPLATLVWQFSLYPEVQSLNGQIAAIQLRKDDAIERGDFESAARLRDEMVEKTRALEDLLLRLREES